MTVQQRVSELLDLSGGDAHKALVMAVEAWALTGYCVSAGFIRVSPHDTVKPPKPQPEPLDA